MFPMLLDLTGRKVALVGNGAQAVNRLRLLDADEASVTVYAPGASAALLDAAGDRVVDRLPTDADLQGAVIAFVADLEPEQAGGIVERARGLGTLVNTEDIRPLCDFHVPAMVRRGDLLITISTNGKSPGLARRLKNELSDRFGPEWGNRLDEIAEARTSWRAKGLPLAEIGRRTEAMIAERGWL